ncbi:signal peptidase I [Amycolatopsis sp. NPDC059027]|uniref:signal peptidase I n=1 Tax=unclassified Amycolatopsis TaxID=2618356 RepID=UPI00366EA093
MVQQRMRFLPGLVAVALLTGCGPEAVDGAPAPAPATTESRPVDSAAMAPTLREGENVTFRSVVPGTYRAHPGDIVLFAPPPAWRVGDGHRMMLRVVASGGQTVVCCDPADHMLVDGTPLDEPYVHAKPGEADGGQRRFGPVMIPENSLWLLGDNRAEAADSRVRGAGGPRGAVPAGNVIGVLDPPR